MKKNKRILVFFGQGNRNKERYQIEQSKIAVGSGGFLGKGFGLFAEGGEVEDKPAGLADLALMKMSKD